MTDDLVSTQEAAEFLGVSARRVRQLMAAGQLPARRIGNYWVLLGREVKAYRPRPAGWEKGKPRKAAKGTLPAP